MPRMLMPLLALTLFYLSSPAAAQVKLEHKIRDGERSTISSQVKVNQTLTLAGNDVVSGSEQEITINSTNGKRGPDGTIAVKQKITRLKADVEVAGQQLSFDSDKPDAPPPGTAIDVLLDVFKATAKAEWTVKFGQDNRVLAVEGRGKALESLPEALRAATKKQYDPAYLARVANDALDKIADKPVQDGDQWIRESTVRLEAGQSLTFKTTYRYDGVLEQDGKPLHRIAATTTDVEYAMDADSPSPLKLVSSDLKIADSEGTILFDNDAGRIVSDRSKVHITGEMKFEAGGNELPAQLDLTFESTSKQG